MLQKVTYTGNKKIKEKALADLTGLKVGSGYDVGANRESARRIESHYREKGYIHVKVELEKGDSPEDREVVFKIDEGPKVVVTKIDFKGNKFVEAGVTPAIRIWSEEKNRGLVRLWVEDNGIGISPEHRERIFNLFERIHPDHEFAGTGVGLAIVRKAIDRLGGKAGVESEIGKGSRFWIDLRPA
jgi:signal transduction histidine kinase